MKTWILIPFFFINIWFVNGQIPVSDNFTNYCDAVFLANPDPVNPMIIHFLDQSSGQITRWQWSFGDGATSSFQNPEHTYAAGGTYFVCLTISNTDSGNLCHDVLCLAITIHQPGECIADYHYEIDPVDLLKTRFTDHSSGNINSWHWDFGDGSSSNDRNPTHVFPAFGKYRVCLTAYNADSISLCNDVKCDSLTFKPPDNCHAGFSNELDTLNPVPNTFIFKNKSTGDPNSFFWSFDDGAVYNTPNVTHHFQSAGQHTVCLLIKKEDHGAVVCKDSLCITVTTAKYFDLGGHLFTGEFPINNPVSTGDTGVAYLYRVDGARLTPYSSGHFTYLGYYAFPKVLNGSYVVKAGLTPGSQHAADYFPSYSQQALKWQDAHVLHLSEASSYAADIRLLPRTASPAGSGRITGTTLKANINGAGDQIPYAEVILFDEQLNPLNFTLSGNSGQFRFENISFGAYYLHVEFPGKYSRLTAVWLDAITPAVDNIHLEVFDHDVTAMPETSDQLVVTGDLFPNPAGNEVNLKIILPKHTILKLEIKSLTGLTAWSGKRPCVAGFNHITIPLGSIKPGIYFFIVKAPDGSAIAVKKLLKF